MSQQQPYEFTQWTDAFGTRLNPIAIADGIRAAGMDVALLEIHNDGLLLKHGAASEIVCQKALTWILSCVSPFVPLEHKTVEGLSHECKVVDIRTKFPGIVVLGEAKEPQDLPVVLGDLLTKVAIVDTLPTPGASVRFAAPVGPWARILPDIATTVSKQLVSSRISADKVTLSVIVEKPTGPQLLSPDNVQNTLLHILLWFRKGGEQGVQPALLVAISQQYSYIQQTAQFLDERSTANAKSNHDLYFDGLVWAVGRRPTIAAPSSRSAIAKQDGTKRHLAIVVDTDRCTQCGLCSEICPVDYLDEKGHAKVDDPSQCVRCYDCVEACPQDALRPTQHQDSGMLSNRLFDIPGWFARLRGSDEPAFPSLFPPSYLLPKKNKDKQPRYVLGISATTAQEHAAVLLKDGIVVGAVEEERIARKRHYGWTHRNRPGATLCVDPRIALEEAFPRRSIRVLLEREGITLDDIDVIALNSIPARYRNTWSLTNPEKNIKPITAGRVMCIPHHVSHAASAFRASGMESAWVFVVDGSGERDTATLFRATKEGIIPLKNLCAYVVGSIGGVYETATIQLGMGSHGHGSLMALGAMGNPKYDIRPWFSVRNWEDVSIDEVQAGVELTPFKRKYQDPITDDQRDMAASVQYALEQVVMTLLKTGGVPQDADGLCLVGGVALNCRMNGLIHRTFRPQKIFAQPGANDAGTALGAALQAWVTCTGTSRWAMDHSLLGPDFSDEQIELELSRHEFVYERATDVAKQTATMLANGEILCWFSGRMEFGPRALGARSILADPRQSAYKERMNQVKERQLWRPFAPSILSGHEQTWFEDAFDSRYMLFAVQVRKEYAERVPVIVHADGSTRPQAVHQEHQPLYYQMIEEFYKLTGVPMVVNTSFNRQGEAIVCTPRDAIESFRELPVDALVIGNFVVRKQKRQEIPLPDVSVLSALPGGRTLMLRLEVSPDTHEVFSPLKDMLGLTARTSASALQSLVSGRQAGCDELVILRGEVAGKSYLPWGLKRAREMGYRRIQLQTSGRPLADARIREALSGLVDTYQITLFSTDGAVHDQIAVVSGAFRETIQGLTALVRTGIDVLLLVPVVGANVNGLGIFVQLAQKIGIRRLQFNFPRPVETIGGVITEGQLRLARASVAVRRAANLAREAGLTVSTEGFPHCHMDAWLRPTPDATHDFSAVRIDDLHYLHTNAQTQRSQMRPVSEPCRGCSLKDSCPKTWALYLELYGTNELTAITTGGLS